jgi:hypothetical protein
MTEEERRQWEEDARRRLQRLSQEYDLTNGDMDMSNIEYRKRKRNELKNLKSNNNND